MVQGLNRLLLRQLKNAEDAVLDKFKGETEFWPGDAPEFREINEYGLLLLVALRHEYERKLLSLAARKGKVSLSYREFEEGVSEWRSNYRDDGWKALKTQLDLGRLSISNQYKALDESMQVLRLLANSYKHNEWGGPDEDLLKLLDLSESERYQELAYGGAVLQALGDHLGIGPVYSYCPVVEEFEERVKAYIGLVEAQGGFAEVEDFCPFDPEYLSR